MIASLLIPLIKMDINLYTNDNYREIKFKIQEPNQSLSVTKGPLEVGPLRGRLFAKVLFIEVVFPQKL